MLLHIEERQIQPGITLVELKGKLALGRESQRIESLVEEMAKSGRTRAILDMTLVDYIDSSGIGLLALASGRMREAGGMLAIVTSGGKVLQMLKLTQMHSILKVCGTVDEAVEACGGATFPPAAA
jgi:anti-sigma B factor antagonist